MQRYHKKVYFPESDTDNLNTIVDRFNSIEGFGFTDHCLENLKYRAVDSLAVLTFIRDEVYFSVDQVFEYYTLDGVINKVCFRLPYNNGIDLILILSKEKAIITIYINSADDKHETLNESLYQRA